MRAFTRSLFFASSKKKFSFYFLHAIGCRFLIRRGSFEDFTNTRRHYGLTIDELVLPATKGYAALQQIHLGRDVEAKGTWMAA